MKGKITTLVENSVARPGVCGEHGLAVLIEIDGKSVLFDTGATDLLLLNAKTLGTDLSNVDSIVLSHGHYDHTGGLAAALSTMDTPVVYAHPDAFLRRYVRWKGDAREIGIPHSKEAIEGSGGKLSLSSKPQEVAPGIMLTGEVPRITAFEDTGGAFFLDEECSEPDLINDDQAIVIDAPEGLIVIVGCAHSGIVNTLLRVQRLFPDVPVSAIVGGMHLINASEERMAETVVMLRSLDPRQVVAGHCTGWKACCRLADRFGDVFDLLSTGYTLSFG